MRSTSRILLAAFAAVADASLAPRAEAADSAEDCVRLASNPVAKGISLEVDNHCDRALSCRLSWVVTCESATGRITRTKPGAAQLSLASSASGSALASSAECGDGWHVDDIRWSCSPR